MLIKATQMGVSARDEILNDHTLTERQKILLLTDGTVTDLLLLFTGENIRAKVVGQTLTRHGRQPLLRAPKSATFLTRDVVLMGDSNRYLVAESAFVYERLSAWVRRGLLESERPIGTLWKEEKSEIFRELVDYQKSTCKRLSQLLNIDGEAPLLSRSYVVYSKGAPIGLIKESFPCSFLR